MSENKKAIDMTPEELEALFADKTMPEWFDYLTPEEETQWLSLLELPSDENDIQRWLDTLTPPEDLQKWLEQLQSQEDTSEKEIPCFYFSNPDPYARPQPLPPDRPCHNIRFDEDGNIHVKNLSAYWIPELTITEEISGTVYTVTGSYEGTESFVRKLERIHAKKFTELMEDSE